MKIKQAPLNTVSARRAATGSERGAALLLSLIILALMGAIAMTVLAVATPEVRIAGSDLCRTQTFYATAAGIEKMTTDFSALFNYTSRPTTQQLNDIANAPPTELVSEHFTFTQSMALDQTTLNEMRAEQGIVGNAYPRVTIPSGPFTGLLATVAPYHLESTAVSAVCQGDVKLERTINNYLIPLFQFGMFSNEDLELHPGPQFTFNGRVHANGNIYVNGRVTFLAKVTTGNEIVREVLRNGAARNDPTVTMQVGAISVSMSKGSVNLGPNLSGATYGQRGYFPTSPNGTINTSWNTSVAAAVAGTPNKFGGQLLTRSTGASQLLLPIQLDGNPTREIIKRAMPDDGETLSQSRYHNKAQIRILLDDEGVSTNAAGILAGQGQLLSTFKPVPLPELPTASGGGRALWQINDAGSYVTTATTAMRQNNLSNTLVQADTVRGVKVATEYSAYNVKIPGGSGIRGRIIIQIVSPSGVIRDVTKEVLSMGMTEGEPNAIVHLQRPLWAAFTQGSRDATGGNNHLTYITNNTSIGADGEIKTTSGVPVVNSTYYYLTSIQEDTPSGQQPTRADAPPALNPAAFAATMWNSIVPINVYNVREGYIKSTLDANTVYERGITSVVQLNMRNLARWVDGVYDTNLLAGTPAVSSNINGADGYVVYVSDRRGDKVKTERSAGGSMLTTNGLVDNEDIYGPNNILDPGEDVIDFSLDPATSQQKKNSLQKDITELPDPSALTGTSGTNRFDRALKVASWSNPSNYFRRSVRLFNGENLQISGAANKLSSIKGISVATENMLYIWGNFNTTGINGQPANGSTLNDSSQTYYYLGNQVPTSIVGDALFPLSKTWYDAMTAAYPDDLSKRQADASLPNVGAETSVRSGVIAGNNLSALAGSPDAGNGAAGESRLNGGMHNFPRFLENWGQRWNFVGSLIPLYRSTQALGPYNANSTIYGAPVRNWAFDETFKDPNKLPPGTLSFQYIEPTGFRQLLY